jgi:hypothetical protein
MDKIDMAATARMSKPFQRKFFLMGYVVSSGAELPRHPRGGFSVRN